MTSKSQNIALGLYITLFGVLPFLAQSRVSTFEFLVVVCIQLACTAVLLLNENTCHTCFLKRQTAYWLPRFSLLFMLPWLSDDVFRYLWDGLVFAQGTNPYAHTPASMSDMIRAFPDLYQLTDYKDVHTTYPPLSQVIFAIPGFVISVTKSWLAGLVVFKIMLLASEYYALKLLQPSERSMFWYSLCPLPVIEIAGQAHLDGLLLLPLAILIVQVSRNGTHPSILKGGLALASLALLKLYPAVVGISLLRSQTWRPRAILVCSTGAVITTLTIGMFLYDPVVLEGVMQSLRTYSLDLQFNGVALYLLKGVLMVFGVNDYWLVAPFALTLLRVAAVLVVGVGTRSDDKQSLAKAMILILTVTILLSSKVHVWYFLPLLALNTVAGYTWVWVMASLSLFTYAAYLGGEFQEQYTLQYVLWTIVASVATLEWYFGRKPDKRFGSRT